MNRLLLYVHYNKNADVHAHVQYQLAKLRSHFKRIVFISNSPIASSGRSSISPFVDEIFERANAGYDFYAWKEAIDREGHCNMTSYDSVTLMNDTCFGPLLELGAIYSKMESRSCDFWGMTNHKSGDVVIPELGISIPEHVQSYFLVFAARVVSSSDWKRFWDEMECETNVYRVIAKYEVQLTRILCDAGFKYDVLLDTLTIDLASHELSYLPAHHCLERRVPFLKIKSLLQHPSPKFILEEMGRLFDYPIHLIEKYMSREFQPDRAILFFDKTLDLQTFFSASINLESRGRIAIHVHVYYLDVWSRYVEYLCRLGFDFDLYVTTDDDQKATLIRAALESNCKALMPKELRVLPNRGRDVLPWLALADRLGEYDYVLHVHTKKSPTASSWVGASWQQDIFDTLLQRATDIVRAFELLPNLGIVIPDVPRYWRDVLPTQSDAIDRMMNDLWRRMCCAKAVDFNGADMFIMPYGTMFWYRPEALKRMTSLSLTEKDVPGEPLPEQTVLHALERLVVYTAWEEGFDYGIVPLRERVSGFAEVIARKRLTSQILAN